MDYLFNDKNFFHDGNFFETVKDKLKNFFNILKN